MSDRDIDKRRDKTIMRTMQATKEKVHYKTSEERYFDKATKLLKKGCYGLEVLEILGYATTIYR